MSRQCRYKVELIQLGSAREKYGVWTRPKIPKWPSFTTWRTWGRHVEKLYTVGKSYPSLKKPGQVTYVSLGTNAYKAKDLRSSDLLPLNDLCMALFDVFLFFRQQASFFQIQNEKGWVSSCPKEPSCRWWLIIITLSMRRAYVSH